eukprot:GHVS01060000.1.p1 GENE.GHVS01060000.1~~GHVS01060000.1.p1  ORF type:complete len:497 (-),score=36.70 GHVS01060000.1:216-1706(-)
MDSSGFDCSYSSWEELEVPNGLTTSDLLDEVFQYYFPPSSNHPHKSRFSGLAEWQADFLSLSYVQILARHAPHLLAPHLDHLCPVLNNLCNNLRSGVCKNGLLAVAYIARGITFPYFTPCIPILLPTLLTRSLSDKRFISDSAWLACSTIAGPNCSCETAVYSIMHMSRQHKNSAIFVAKCAELLKLAIQSMLSPPPSLGITAETDSLPSTNPFSDDPLATAGEFDPSGRSMRLYHQHRAATGHQRRCAENSPRSPGHFGGSTVGGKRQMPTASRSISSPHLPQPVRGGGGSPGSVSSGSRGTVFLRGIGTILSGYLTERLPATKNATRQTLIMLIGSYGEEHVKHCLMQNGNVDSHSGASQGGAMGAEGLIPLRGPARETLQRALTEAAAAVNKQDPRKPAPAASIRVVQPKPSSTPTSVSNSGTSTRVSSFTPLRSPPSYIACQGRGPAVVGGERPLCPSATPPAFRRPLQLPHTMMPEGPRYAYPPSPPYYGP